MGAQQVPRRSGGLAHHALLLTVAALLLARSGDARADAPASIPVVVVDLRPGDAAARRTSRDAFTAELGSIAGVELVSDDELSSALVGEPEAPIDREVRRRAADRMSAVLAKRSNDDCSGRNAEARDAIADLAALEAAGRKVRPELTLAYVYQLRCAHDAGDAIGAARAAAMLRAIGHTDAPTDVDDATWAAYPATAAAPTGALRVEGPPGAAVWVDHQQIGVAPVEIPTAAGTRLIAVSGDDGLGSQRVEVTAAVTPPLTITTERAPRRWAGARTLVASWRNGSGSANALAIARLLTETGVRHAILLSAGDRAELWRLPQGANAAERVRQGTLRAPMVLGTALAEEAGVTPAAEDAVPILTEDAKDKDQGKRQKWWVYAGIIGAVAVGAGIILANDLADDRQRIELTWP